MAGSTIVCATGDDQVLAQVRAQLDHRGDGWDLRCLRSGPETIDLLRTVPVEALVTDSTMPGADGASLLEYVHRHHPAIARLVLSGQPGQAVRIDGVGPLHELLSKPCTPDTLERALDLVLELRALVQSERLRALFGSLDTLAKPPHIYSQLVALSEDPNSTAEDVVGLIQQDVGLTAEVLRLVNSAFYSQAATVQSIQWAVVLLGLETIKSLAIAGVVFRPGTPLPEGLDSTELADRAVRASAIAQRIARRENWDLATVSDVTLGALLSEVGLLVLAPANPDQWEQLRGSEAGWAEGGAQQTAFGCTVGRASAYLLGQWGFPAGAVAATAMQPLDVADPAVLESATPAALVVAFAQLKARGQAEAWAFGHSGYLDERRLARWQSA